MRHAAVIAHFVKSFAPGKRDDRYVVQIKKGYRIEAIKTRKTTAMRAKPFLIRLVLSKVRSASPNDNHGYSKFFTRF